jgi:transposase
VIRSWVKKAQASSAAGVPAKSKSADGLEEEVHRLRREVSTLREEREILKKAAAFFAKESR